MENWINKVVLISNCATEVGRKIAQALEKERMIVTSFCKTNNQIEKQKDPASDTVKLKIYPCDFTNLKSIQFAFDKIVETHGGVDVVINIINCEKDCNMRNSDLKEFKQIVDENVSATVAIIRLVVGSMIERKTRGHIINITKLKQSDKQRSVQNAATAAIESVNEILRHEFRYLNVNIKTTHIEYFAEDFSLTDLKMENVALMVKSVLDTPEHLQIHELHLA